MSELFLGADPIRTADALEALARDLRRLAIRMVPPARTLADAPLLTDWALCPRRSPALLGSVEGHPLLGTLRVGLTSELFALDGAGGWARTLNRFYRLGPSAEAQQSLNATRGTGNENS